MSSPLFGSRPLVRLPTKCVPPHGRQTGFHPWFGCAIRGQWLSEFGIFQSPFISKHILEPIPKGV